MHEWGDSGITAVCLALIIAVLISVGVAQQARARAARYQEIRRLQSEAAQEAQREEAQAAAEYKSMVAIRNAICAICYNTSSTRCSRCKSVRYCSAACQALHWNQGHKQECRAPDPPSSGSSIASSRNFSDVFSRSSSTSESRTLSEVSDYQGSEDKNHFELSRSPSSNGVTANGDLPKPKKVLFPYKSFVRFFNYDRLRVPPCGLINCGNSCFANVVLQCLTYTRPLTAYLLDGSHGDTCTRNDWCFMCELQDHVYRVRQEQSAFSPIRILSRIRNIGNHLGYGRQEDAHEFMRFAIDSMQSTCLDEFGGEKSVDSRSQETTLIHHIFGGHLQSQVQCMGCLHESNRYEKMMDLAVEIHGSVETLEDALAQFTAPEWLDGDNKYKCDRCNAYVKARKRLTLHEAPNILTIALKRFQSGKFGKLNKRVTFPELLDMMPYVSGKGDRPPSYMLYAVVVHVDMLNASFFGHYICYVKDSQGIWYKIDDSKVKEVDIEKVMSQRAYMLLYTRSAARPAPEMDDEVVAVNLPTTGRPMYDDVRVVKVYPEASHLIPGVMPAVGGTMGLHAMVEPRQREGMVEGGPLTVKAHAFVNGEHATTQPSSWERDVACEGNDDEISVEESGTFARSSSHSVISPTSSSYLSTEEPGVVRKILVCNPPGSSNEEDTELASRDLLSPMSSDLAEISLNVTSLEKPLTPKIGKRRLDEGLTPLAAPKPLDTDQLPAWPASSNGRLSPSPPVCLSAANQMNGVPPNGVYHSRQKYLGDKTGESPGPPASPVQHRLSGDQTYLAASADSGCDPERSYLDMMNYSQSAGTSDEDLEGRAKRQHVEVENSEFSLMQRVTRPSGIAQALEQPDVSTLNRRDMEWNELVLQPGSPAPVAVSGPVFDSCADILPTDNNHCAPASEVQTIPSSLRQVLLNQQVEDRSTERFHTDETLSIPGVHPPSTERAVEGTGLSLEGDLWSTLEQSPTSSAMVYGAPGGSSSVDEFRVSRLLQCEGAPDIEPLEKSEGDGVSSEDLEAVPIRLLKGQPADPLQTSQITSETQSEIPPRVQTHEVTSSPIPTPHVDCTTEDGVSTTYSKRNGLAVYCAETARFSVSEQDTDLRTSDESVAPAKIPRQKSTLKPLFARGFLNRISSPVLDSLPGQGSNGTTGGVKDQASNGVIVEPDREENGTSGRCYGVGNGHASFNGSEDGPPSVQTGNDRRVSTGSVSNGVGNGFLPTASSNGGATADSGNGAGTAVTRNGGATPVSGNGAGTAVTRNGGETTVSSNGGATAVSSNGAASGSSSHGHEEAFSPHGNGGLQNGVKPYNSQGYGEVKQQNKAAGKGKRFAIAHVGSGALPAHLTEEQATQQAAPTVQVTGSSLARPASGKQKQGRNESCHCGSQRKWKKCCGKSEGMTPEIRKRRIII